MNREIKMYTQEELAEILKLPVSTLERWRSRPPEDNVLPFVYYGKHVRYNHRDVERWIERNTWDKSSDRNVG